MTKKNKQKTKDFDQAFDEGNISIDFSSGIPSKGLSKLVKLPPLTIPAWLNSELENISRLQSNSKSSVIRQLLVEALLTKKKLA